MIALGASSQTGLPAPDSYREPDSLTCYTPTQIRQIAKGLTELDYARAQLALQDSITTKMQALHTQTANELEACEQEMVSSAEKVERLKRQRKWWAIIGMAVGVIITAVASDL